MIFVIFYVQASKWDQNDLQAQKQLQILKAQAFSFPMIYIMSGYEKIDFMTFFYVRAPKWIKMTLMPKNNYRFLNRKLSALQ